MARTIDTLATAQQSHRWTFQESCIFFRNYSMLQILFEDTPDLIPYHRHHNNYRFLESYSVISQKLENKDSFKFSFKAFHKFPKEKKIFEDFRKV